MNWGLTLTSQTGSLSAQSQMRFVQQNNASLGQEAVATKSEIS